MNSRLTVSKTPATKRAVAQSAVFTRQAPATEGRQSKRQTAAALSSGVHTEKLPETRNFRDGPYMARCIERLHSFLYEHHYDSYAQLPEIGSFNSGLPLKTLIEITNFIVSIINVGYPQLDPQTRDSAAVHGFFVSLLQDLRYPEVSIPKPNDIKACSQTPASRKFVLILLWLSELVSYAEAVLSKYSVASVDVSAQDLFKKLIESPNIDQALGTFEYFAFIAARYAVLMETGSIEKIMDSLSDDFSLFLQSVSFDIQKHSDRIKTLTADLARKHQTLRGEAEAIMHSVAAMGGGDSGDFLEQIFANEGILGLKKHALERARNRRRALEENIAALAGPTRADGEQALQGLRQRIAQKRQHYAGLIRERDALADALKRQTVSLPEYQRLQFDEASLKRQLDFAEEECSRKQALLSSKIEQYDEMAREVRTLVEGYSALAHGLPELADALQERVAYAGAGPGALTSASTSTSVGAGASAGARPGDPDATVDVTLNLLNPEKSTRINFAKVTPLLKAEARSHDAELLQLKLSVTKLMDECSRRRDALGGVGAELAGAAELLAQAQDELDTRCSDQRAIQEQYNARLGGLKAECAQLEKATALARIACEELRAGRESVDNEAAREAQRLERELVRTHDVSAAVCAFVTGARARTREQLSLLRDKLAEFAELSSGSVCNVEGLTRICTQCQARLQ